MKHQLRAAANAGRGGDTMLAHLSPGEIVVPASAQSPELRQMLAQALVATGHDPGRYVIGGTDDSRNPRTGLREFYDAGDGMGGAETGGDNQGGIGGATGPDFGGANYGGRDEGDRARAASEAAAPGTGPFSGATYDTHGYGQNTLAGYRSGIPGMGWVGRQVDKAVANPISTGINMLASFTPLGALNTLSGLFNGPTVGSAGTAIGRSVGRAMGFGAPVSENTSGPSAPQQPGDRGTEIRFALARALTGG